VTKFCPVTTYTNTQRQRGQVLAQKDPLPCLCTAPRRTEATLCGTPKVTCSHHPTPEADTAHAAWCFVAAFLHFWKRFVQILVERSFLVGVSHAIEALRDTTPLLTFAALLGLTYLARRTPSVPTSFVSQPSCGLRRFWQASCSQQARAGVNSQCTRNSMEPTQHKPSARVRCVACAERALLCAWRYREG
jgi:hypothetical protein